MLHCNKIHIAAIQETHIPKDYNYKYNGSRITTSAAIQEPNIDINTAKGMSTEGVDILIREVLGRHIMDIVGINERIAQITLRIPNSHTPLTILCTYAPNTGKRKTEQKKRW